MTTYTHADLSAALNKRRNLDLDVEDVVEALLSTDALLMDTLAAIHYLHQRTGGSPGYSHPHGFCMEDQARWPCATVQIVADALRKMGAL